ncbi:MAG: hypothetical protein Q7R45_15110, partial [Sulfuricaulis sp.]|nr:hypothetical protein [Sulfuricaulis sp.]
MTIKSLASSLPGARPSAQPVQRGGGNRTVQRVAQFAARDALAVTDDLGIRGVTANHLRILIRARERFTNV